MENPSDKETEAAKEWFAKNLEPWSWPRDPDRIGRILFLLELIWHRNPDLRLCQLIINVADMPDPFYLEDDKMEELLQEYLEKGL